MASVHREKIASQVLDFVKTLVDDTKDKDINIRVGIHSSADGTGPDVTIYLLSGKADAEINFWATAADTMRVDGGMVFHKEADESGANKEETLEGSSVEDASKFFKRFLSLKSDASA